MPDELLKEFQEIAKQVHHADCGEVGDTGEHGDLGVNAADHPVRKAQDAAEIVNEDLHGSESYAAMQARVEGDLWANKILSRLPAPGAVAPEEIKPEDFILAGLIASGYSETDARQMAAKVVKLAPKEPSAAAIADTQIDPPAANVIAVPATTDAKPAFVAEEAIGQISSSLVLTGCSEEAAVALAKASIDQTPEDIVVAGLVKMGWKPEVARKMAEEVSKVAPLDAFVNAPEANVIVNEDGTTSPVPAAPVEEAPQS
jgi:hypothetical protein